MMGYYGPYYGHWGIGGGIFGFFFWILIVVAIIGVIRYMTGGRYRQGGRFESQNEKSGALSILNERYAKGEINKDEYEQKKKDILG